VATRASADLRAQAADAWEVPMLGVVVVLVLLWALGFMTRYTLGGLLHILLVIAIVLALVTFIQRRV
jgi:hypothetical protein